MEGVEKRRDVGRLRVTPVDSVLRTGWGGWLGWNRGVQPGCYSSHSGNRQCGLSPGDGGGSSEAESNSERSLKAKPKQFLMHWIRAEGMRRKRGLRWPQGFWPKEVKRWSYRFVNGMSRTGR